MTTAINYASTPLLGCANLTTGDTSRTAPTTAPNMIVPTGGTGPVANAANGAQIERLTITPLATCTSSTVRIFFYDGTSYHLKVELPLNGQTLSASVAATSQMFEAVDNPNMFPMLLPAGWSLRASINDTQAGGINVFADAGGF